MKYCQAQAGRIFILRLEDGEILHETVEHFAVEHKIGAASVIAVGGADRGSRLVVGPRDGRARPVTPMENILDNVHEIAGVGTLFADEDGRPVLHMHLAAGRETDTVTGCVRNGVRVWQVMEVVLREMTGTAAIRRKDQTTGFALLDPAPPGTDRLGRHEKRCD